MSAYPILKGRDGARILSDGSFISEGHPEQTRPSFAVREVVVSNVVEGRRYAFDLAEPRPKIVEDASGAWLCVGSFRGAGWKP